MLCETFSNQSPECEWLECPGYYICRFDQGGGTTRQGGGGVALYAVRWQIMLLMVTKWQS